MTANDWLAESFEENRPRLKAVAYRMLGSLPEAEDAVQEAWLRLSRDGANGVDNLRAWLTTVVARICLNVIRARNLHGGQMAEGLPDPLISSDEAVDPEYQALLADSVGLALQVVLDTLSPSERLSFVLHDMFDVPFEQIAAMTGGTPAAARQSASRARRRVKGQAPSPDGDLAEQRAAVNAYFAAARGGNFDALVALLHPDVVLRGDGGSSRPGLTRTVRGAEQVARSALAGAVPTATLQPLLINGAAGVLVHIKGRPFAILAFHVVGGQIVEIDALADPDRLRDALARL